MEYNIESLRFFEFDCPFDHLDSKVERDLFSAILHLRKQGYLSRHRYGVLPTDTYDFIGKHYGIMVDSNEGPQVLMSYRTVTLDRCQEFNLALPIENILKSAGASDHLEILADLKIRSESEERPLVYTSSWTVSPKLRSTPELFDKAYDFLTSLNVHALLEDPRQLKIACGSLRLKTHEYIQWLGYKLFEKNQQTLPCFKQYNLNNEDVVVLLLTQHSPEAIETATTHTFQWKKRLQLTRPTAAPLRKVA